MLVYGECECFLMQMFVSCVQCCVLHDLQFVNAGRGCNRRPYRRGILQSRSHNCSIGSHECLLLFTPSCCSKCFYDLYFFSGVFAITERSDMGLYEVPLSASLLGFGIGTMLANFHV